MRLMEPHLGDAPLWCDDVRQRVGRDTIGHANGGVASAGAAFGARIEALLTDCPSCCSSSTVRAATRFARAVGWR